MKHSSVILSIVLVIAILLHMGCKKSNHDTFVALGDEAYMKSADDMYLQKYRYQWPTLCDDYYLQIIDIKDEQGNIISHDTILKKIIGNDTLPPYDEGIFPPDITGKYIINGSFVGGNDSTISNGGIHVPVLNYPPEQVITLDVYYQQNGFAKINYYEYFPGMPYVSEFIVDSAYVYGHGSDGDFTLLFDMHDEAMGADDYYGILITGRHSTEPYYVIDGNGDTLERYLQGGIHDVYKWKLFKHGKTQYVVGGQHLYVDDFAERVE